jgi:hypothetical protein
VLDRSVSGHGADNEKERASALRRQGLEALKAAAFAAAIDLLGRANIPSGWAESANVLEQSWNR